MPGKAGNSLYSLLNVEREEQSRVSLLLLQSLFLGVFYGTLDIGAHALFLSEYTEEMLPMAFLISGGVGIVLTTIYTRLQSVLKFSTLSILNLLFVTLIMGLLWYGFRLADLSVWVFVLFVMMGPLNIIAMIGFGGTVSRMFSLRQGKRLFGLVDAGQILGIIISSYAVPFILDAGFSTINLLLISSISILFAFVLQLFISGRFNINRLAGETEGAGEDIADSPVAKAGSSFMDLLKKPYTRVMAVFVGLSVVVAFLVHYSFIAVANIQYPQNTELAKFLGYFMGTLTVFTFLIKTLVYSRLMNMYGLKLSLVLSPLLITLFTIASVVVGSLLGYSAESAGFGFFFLLVALTKLFAKALKDSVEMPSFKILYLSLEERIRYDMQARIDGTVNEISAVSSGAIMVGLAAIPFIMLIHFSYVLAIFVVLWIFVAFRLYNYYKQSLKDSLAGIKDMKSSIQESDQSLIGCIEELVNEDILSPDAANTISTVYSLKGGEEKESLSTTVFNSMMRDPSPKIREKAIRMAGTSGDMEYAPVLIDLLGSRDHYAAAFYALQKMGSGLLPVLEGSFYKTGQGLAARRRILRLMGIFAGDEAVKYLLPKLLLAERQLVEESVRSLAACSFRAGEEEKTQFFNITEQTVRNLAWMLAARISAEGMKHSGLKEVIEEELKDSYDFLYEILSLLYDRNTIMYISDSLDRGSAESVSYALELLDLVLDEEIKPVVLPAINDIPDEDKLKQLQEFFPAGKMKEKDLLLSIINRDYNRAGLSLKIQAMDAWFSLNGKGTVPDDIVAILFHPNPVISEISSVYLYRAGVLDHYMERLDKQRREHIENILEKSRRNENELSLNKISFLSGLEAFKMLPGRIRCSLAGKLEYKDDLNDRLIIINSETLDISLPVGGNKGSYTVPGAVLLESLFDSQNQIKPFFRTLS